MFDLDFAFADDRQTDDEIFGEPNQMLEDAIMEVRHEAIMAIRRGDFAEFRRLAAIADR